MIEEEKFREGLNKLFTGELEPKPDEGLREWAENIVDGALTSEVIIVLNLDREKIKAIKDWSDNQIKANYALRENTITQILTKFKNYVGLDPDQSLPDIPEYIKDFGGNDSIYEEAQQDMKGNGWRKVLRGTEGVG